MPAPAKNCGPVPSRPPHSPSSAMGPNHQVIQLYEMIVVRHGLMLVGPTGGGKSSNLHVLEETLSRLKSMGEEVRVARST